MTIPQVWLAKIIGSDGMNWEIDGEVEGVHLCAVVVVFVSVEIVTTCGDGGITATRPLPSIAFALCDGKGLMFRIIDGEMDGDCGVTICSIGESLCIVT